MLTITTILSKKGFNSDLESLTQKAKEVDALPNTILHSNTIGINIGWDFNAELKTLRQPRLITWKLKPLKLLERMNKYGCLDRL